MSVELASMAVRMPEVTEHPNRAAFQGVLTVVDTPSQRAPSGAGGHRVLLTRAAAETAIPSLLGMALDYAPGFNRHDMRRKVGVITSADIVERNLEIGGYLYAKDFPEVAEEIATAGRKKTSVRPQREGSGFRASGGKDSARLRTSLAYAVERLRSVTGVPRVPGENAVPGLRAEAAAEGGENTLGMSYEVTNVILEDRRSPIWTLLQVTFTGAAILRRRNAAYQETWIELCS